MLRVVIFMTALIGTATYSSDSKTYHQISNGLKTNLVCVDLQDISK